MRACVCVKQYMTTVDFPLLGDTMSMMDRRALDLCTIVWTFVTYVVADLDSMLPRADDPATTVTANAANPIMLNTKLGFIAIFIYLYTRMGYH